MSQEVITKTETNPQRPNKVVVAALAGLTLLGAGCSSKYNSFGGGCHKFGVYAQDRYNPLGAAVRAEPDVLSKKLEPGFAGNEVVAVDGWVHASAAYPHNPAPWNSDVWFHLANRSGWVSFAGVRVDTTTPDPTGGLSPEGGQPAPVTADCEGSYHQ